MKIGRNDPCPCGSGRKYKHCCLDKDRAKPGPAPSASFADNMARPDAADAVLESLSAAAEGKEFRSIDEIEAFVSERVSRENDSPVEDFEGLSPDQMNRILGEGFEDHRGLVSCSLDLEESEVLSALLLRVVKWVLSYYADRSGEVKLTDTGNHNRALCRAYCLRHVPGFGTGMSVPLETTMVPLETAHDAIVALGYTQEGPSGRAWLTTEGVYAFSHERWGNMYGELFGYLTVYHDWQQWLPEELRSAHFELVRKSAVFLLYLLHRHPEGKVGDFFDRFARAFPVFIQPAEGSEETVDYLLSIVSQLFFSWFCTFMGFVEIDDDAGDTGMFRDVWYEATPLFKRALEWHL